MIRSRFASIVAIACLTASALASTASSVGRAVAATFRDGWDYVFGRIPVGPSEPKSQASPCPRMALVAARSFLDRLMRRERPTVTPRWRMCPSA